MLQSDYEAANYDVKKAKGYWQLGRLGPEETQELQAKVNERHLGAQSGTPCWHRQKYKSCCDAF